MNAIAMAWARQISLAKSVANQYKDEPHSALVLQVWKSTRLDNVHCEKSGGKYTFSKDMRYANDNNNFLYSLTAFKQGCNCQCGVMMLYELIKAVRPKIDIRTVYSCGHVAIAVKQQKVGEHPTTRLLETTEDLEFVKLETKTEYNENSETSAFINPQDIPQGCLHFTSLMQTWVVDFKLETSDYAERLIRECQLDVSSNLQVQLFVKYKILNSPISELEPILKIITDVAPFLTKDCGYFNHVSILTHWFKDCKDFGLAQKLLNACVHHEQTQHEGNFCDCAPYRAKKPLGQFRHPPSHAE